MSTTDATTVADTGKSLKSCTCDSDRRNWSWEMCSLAACNQYFFENKEIKRCETELAPKVKNSTPYSAPRHLPCFKPVTSTPPTPKTPSRDNPNSLRKIKESKHTPKQLENSHPTTFNISRVKTGGALVAEMDKTTPRKKPKCQLFCKNHSSSEDGSRNKSSSNDTQNTTNATNIHLRYHISTSKTTQITYL